MCWNNSQTANAYTADCDCHVCELAERSTVQFSILTRGNIPFGILSINRAKKPFLIYMYSILRVRNLS